MVIQTPIKCPDCKKYFDHLSFWKKVEDHYFYLCEDCIKEEMSKEDILMIGFHHGKEYFKEIIRDFINEGDMK